MKCYGLKIAYIRADGRGWSDSLYRKNARLNRDGTNNFFIFSNIGDGTNVTHGRTASSSLKFEPNEWVQLECFYHWSVAPERRITYWQNGRQIWDI